MTKRKGMRQMTLSDYTSVLPVRTRSMNDYLSDISRTTVMTAAEEKEIFARLDESKMRLDNAMSNPEIPVQMKRSIERNEKRIQNEIRNRVLTANQRYVFAVAKRYHTSVDIMDLVSVGNIGMIEAFDEFDRMKNYRFLTLASFYIRRAINTYLSTEHVLVRAKSNSRIASKIKKIENDFFVTNGRNPSGTEVIELLSEKYGVNVSAVDDIYEAKALSISDFIGDDDDYTMEEKTEYNMKSSSVNEYEAIADKDANAAVVDAVMSVLTEKERTVVAMFAGYGYDKEYRDSEIADRMGYSTERVRQIRKSAIRKMSKARSSLSLRKI